MNLNIANILTLLRFFLAPVFVYVFFVFPDKRYLSAAVFVLAGVTDVLDGFIARRFNMTTELGKLLDPLADKLMQLTALICVGIVYPSVRWALYIILAKETLMMAGSFFLYRRRVVVGANWYGKAATVLFYICLLSIIIFGTFLTPVIWTILLSLAVASAVFAFARYLMLVLKDPSWRKQSGR